MVKICNGKIEVKRIMGRTLRFSSDTFCFYVPKEDEEKIKQVLEDTFN